MSPSGVDVVDRVLSQEDVREVHFLRDRVAGEDIRCDRNCVVGVLLGEVGHATEELIVLDSDPRGCHAGVVASDADRGTLTNGTCRQGTTRVGIRAT